MNLTAVTNPYWDAVKDYARPSEMPWERGVLEVARIFGSYDSDGNLATNFDALPDRQEYVTRYSWTITDPASVEFVQRHSGPDQRLIDPMAGTGYWAYVLGQHGVDVVCYDSTPPGDPEHPNHWHNVNPTWVPVTSGYAEVAIDEHADRTLLLSWVPRHEPSGFRTVREYAGDRVIYIGEGHGGVTGCDDLHDLLDNHWVEVAQHIPVRWWGLHDRITVYERDRNA